MQRCGMPHRTPRRNQPEICQWNCAQLANALLAAELVGKEDAEQVMREYADVSRGGGFWGGRGGMWGAGGGMY
jgi:hypothetical protein